METWDWAKRHPATAIAVVAAVLVVVWYFFFKKSTGGTVGSSYFMPAAAASQPSDGGQYDALVKIAGINADVKTGQQQTDVTLASIAQNILEANSQNELTGYLHALDTDVAKTTIQNQYDFATVSDVAAKDLSAKIAGYQTHRDETNILANKDQALAGINRDLLLGLGEQNIKTAAINLTGQQETAYGIAFKDKLAALVSAGATPNEIGAQTGATPLDLSSWNKTWPAAQDAYTKNLLAYGRSVFGPTYGT